VNITVKDNSAAVIAALKAQCMDGLREIGAKAVKHAQDEIDHAKRVDTGEMRDSIRAEVRGDGVYVGTDNEHAAFHELGTGHYTQPHAGEKYGVKPLHFLHHAAARHTSEYQKIMKGALKR